MKKIWIDECLLLKEIKLKVVLFVYRKLFLIFLYLV